MNSWHQMDSFVNYAAAIRCWHYGMHYSSSFVSSIQLLRMSEEEEEEKIKKKGAIHQWIMQKFHFNQSQIWDHRQTHTFDSGTIPVRSMVWRQNGVCGWEKVKVKMVNQFMTYDIIIIPFSVNRIRNRTEINQRQHYFIFIFF